MRAGIVRLAADERVKNRVLKAGVDIYDKQTGKMRGFHEIMLDLVDASASMTDEQANALSATVFGRRGLLGFGAVAKAQIKVMRNGREVTLKGRDAIAAYAKEMENTAGTAKSFNDALLDTFEGQKQILGGAVETFKVVFGQGFAAVLKPVVRSLAETVGAMAKFFKDLDPDDQEDYRAAVPSRCCGCSRCRRRRSDGRAYCGRHRRHSRCRVRAEKDLRHERRRHRGFAAKHVQPRSRSS